MGYALRAAASFGRGWRRCAAAWGAGRLPAGGAAPARRGGCDPAEIMLPPPCARGIAVDCACRDRRRYLEVDDVADFSRTHQHRRARLRQVRSSGRGVRWHGSHTDDQRRPRHRTDQAVRRRTRRPPLRALRYGAAAVAHLNRALRRGERHRDAPGFPVPRRWGHGDCGRGCRDPRMGHCPRAAYRGGKTHDARHPHRH